MLDAEGLAREADARRRAGFEIELLKPAAVLDRYGIKGRHAIIGFGNYSADTRQLAAGYLNVAIGRGARVYSPVDICEVEPGESGVIDARLPRPTTKTLYGRFGDLLFWLAVLAGLATAVPWARLRGLQRAEANG